MMTGVVARVPGGAPRHGNAAGNPARCVGSYPIFPEAQAR